MSENLEELAKAFEEKHGSSEFIKAACSVVNKLLVDKGLVTADELREYMKDELHRREEIPFLQNISKMNDEKICDYCGMEELNPDDSRVAYEHCIVYGVNFVICPVCHEFDL